MRTFTTSYSYLLDGPPRADGQPVRDYSETSSERFARRRREAAIAASEERASRHAEQAQVERHGPSSRDTLSVIDGDRLFRIVSPGTGSESTVSSKEYWFTRQLDIRKVLSDSAAVGHFKNPH